MTKHNHTKYAIIGLHTTDCRTGAETISVKRKLNTVQTKTSL
ncbi:hypothetical protein [Lentibacillus halodurans]|nr:hypothetical protein [Lentibacillus halodurans]